MMITEREKYVDLLNEFPPRPIRSEQGFEAIQKVVDALLDAKQLSADQKEYLNLLGMIICEYEDKNVKIPDIYGVELLNVLIEEWGLKKKRTYSYFQDRIYLSYSLL